MWAVNRADKPLATTWTDTDPSELSLSLAGDFQLALRRLVLQDVRRAHPFRRLLRYGQVERVGQHALAGRQGGRCLARRRCVISPLAGCCF